MDEFKIIKVFEDTTVKLKLNEQEKSDIFSIKTIIGENNLNLQADGKLIINHYVGFVHVNKTRVLIYPKIARNVQEEDLYSKAFNILIKMLAFSGFSQIKLIDSPQYSEKYSGDVLELFIGLFVDELLFLFKRDINRSYRPTIENQSFIKGKIDFTENIKKNSYRKHLHALKYEEFTENILMNQVFKTVVLNLVKKTTQKSNRIKLGQALLWLEDVEQIKITEDIWSKIAFTRLNHQYKTVFNMAKLFYHNSSVNLNKGDEITFSFLIPVNQLFERYVYELLKQTADPGACVKYQGPTKFLGRLDGKNAFQLRPDISIMKNDLVFMIFDAKYKEIIDPAGDNLVSQSDIYQMLAYSVRYNCNHIVLAYPKMMGCDQNSLELFKIEIPKENGILVIKIIQINVECEVGFTINQLSQYLRQFQKLENDTEERQMKLIKHELSKQALYLLVELGCYEAEFGNSTFGIFVRNGNNHKLVVQTKKGLLEFELINLTQKEIVSALNEMNTKFLNYSTNMHYLIELTDEGRELAKNTFATSNI